MFEVAFGVVIGAVILFFGSALIASLIKYR